MPPPLPRASATLLLTLAATAAAAAAQSVEFRIVERTGQTTILSAADATLNFAVQGRVVDGSPTDFLGNFSFNIVAPGESDSFGALSKAAISNPDGTYNTSATQYSNNATVGRGGLSAVYTYLAGINGTFNGLINTSSAAFTNTAGSQEIGLVTGSPSGGSLLLLVDIDGTNPFPTLDPAITATYLGANANWSDIYHFNYAVADLATPRAMTFTLANVTAEIGTGLQLSNGVWGPIQSPAPTSVTPSSRIFISFPAPGMAATFSVALAPFCCRRRR